MEAACGFEPQNGGFADLSLNHLGTPPERTNLRLKKLSRRFSGRQLSWSKC
jgi:hypothetical protein